MKRCLLLALSFFLHLIPSYACTDFKLTAKDGSILITRSLEFGPELKSNLRSSPRGRLFAPTLTNKQAGLSWKSKYGYLYIDGFGLDASFDGMNEKGLTFEFLYLPGETEYQTVPTGKENQALPYFNFGDWVLSNFETIDDLKKALNQIYVTNKIVPELGNAILPAHASVYEASGKGIVIEFYNNKINVSDNIGTMTNSPKYNWHLTNLRNYINLSATNPNPITQNGITYTGTGQGTGAIGLPGDASPPSRFVKIAFMQKNVYPAENASELLNLAEHIINNVDLPAGYVRAAGDKPESDTTQWVVFKDISHRKFYYRTYHNLALQMISFDRINLAENAPRLMMPLASKPQLIDRTDKFLGSILTSSNRLVD